MCNKKNTVLLITFIFLLILVFAAGMYVKKRFAVNENINDIDVSSVKVNEQFFSSLSEKEIIHYKIINSIDFFDTASGEYEKSNMATKEKEKIYYNVDIKNREGHQKVSNIGNNEESELIIKDGKKIEFDNNRKTYREFKLNIEPHDEIKKLLKPEDRYSKGKGYIIKFEDKYPKDQGFIKRVDDEFLSGASESLFNQDYLISYLENYSNWNIDGYDSYLGRDCVKISGKLGFVGKYGTTKFIAVIDKNTGILLKFENLNIDNKVIDLLETKRIETNTSINSKLFGKDVSGYTKLAVQK